MKSPSTRPTADERPDRCAAFTRTGAPCSAQAVDGRHCAWHSTDPAWVEKRRQWSAKGGAGSSNKARAKKAIPEGSLSIGEVNAIMGKLLTDLVDGTTTPGVVNAAANAARTIDVLTRGADLEEQIAHLRRDLAAFAGRRDAG